MHPTIGEITRVKLGEEVRPDVFRRWQHSLQHDVQPLLNEREALIAENSRLRAFIENLPGHSETVVPPDADAFPKNRKAVAQ